MNQERWAWFAALTLLGLVCLGPNAGLSAERAEVATQGSVTAEPTLPPPGRDSGLATGAEHSAEPMPSEAAVTVLIAKDRVTGHNPAAVLYTSHSYYGRVTGQAG